MTAMEQKSGLFQKLKSDFVSVSFSFVFATVLLGPPTFGIRLSSEKLSIPDKVSSAFSLPAVLSPADSLKSSDSVLTGAEIQEEEVLDHFDRNGLGTKASQRPSTIFMVNLFNELQRGERVTAGKVSGAGTDTIRSFSGRNVKTSTTEKIVVDYKIPYLPEQERLKFAEIRFLRNSTGKARSRKYKFRIDVNMNGKIVSKMHVCEPAAIQNQYYVFDVTNAVSHWINVYHGNINLHIRASKNLHSQVFVTPKDMSFNFTSLIVLYLEDRKFLRDMYSSFTASSPGFVQDSKTLPVRRTRGAAEINAVLFNSSTNSSLSDFEQRGMKSSGSKRRNGKGTKWSKGEGKETCKLYDFEVDFNAIGWAQWIIRPTRFNARFCHGICPSPIDAKLKPTNHAMLQTLMRMKRPKAAPVPCCVPVKLNPISIFYIQNDECVIRHIEDMVAEECGCR